MAQERKDQDSFPLLQQVSEVDLKQAVALDFDESQDLFLRDHNAALLRWVKGIGGPSIIGGCIAYPPISLCAQRIGIKVTFVSENILNEYKKLPFWKEVYPVTTKFVPLETETAALARIEERNQYKFPDFDKFRGQNPTFINYAEQVIEGFNFDRKRQAQTTVGFLWTLDLLQYTYDKLSR